MPRKKVLTKKKYTYKRLAAAAAAKKAAREALHQASSVVLPSNIEPAIQSQVSPALETKSVDCLIQELQSHLKEVHNRDKKLRYKVQKLVLQYSSSQCQEPSVEKDGNPPEDSPDFSGNVSWNSTPAPEKTSAHYSLIHNRK